MTTDSAILVATYEKQVKQLKNQEAVIDERLENYWVVDENFEKVDRTALESLANGMVFQFAQIGFEANKPHTGIGTTWNMLPYCYPARQQWSGW